MGTVVTLMFQMGVYPGVEYRLLWIVDPVKEKDFFYSRRGIDYELKPIYPLVPDRIPSTNPGAEPPRDARDSGSARSHSTHLETSSSDQH